MNNLTLLLAGTALVVWLSRKPLRKPGSHGFYRFFAWEAILGLVVLNHGVWGDDPYSPHQFTSWMLMLLSIFLVAEGTRTLRRHGAASAKRDDGSFYEFEKTTQVVSNGIFGYIRHPIVRKPRWNSKPGPASLPRSGHSPGPAGPSRRAGCFR